MESIAFIWGRYMVYLEHGNCDHGLRCGNAHVPVPVSMG